jgi:putative hydrolase of the HAD superfamily
MRAMGIGAVLFDIGGVLETTPPTGWERRWSERLDLDGTDMVQRLGDIWEAGETGALSLAEVERATADALQLGDTDLRLFMDDLWTEYLGYGAGLRQPAPPVPHRTPEQQLRQRPPARACRL